MSLYCIGDLQGCNEPFQRLLEKIDFSPSRDTLYLLGDLVNRGPHSLAVLRYLSRLGDAAQSLLGNHDLHLLALWQGMGKLHRSDTAQDILQASDRGALLEWLRHRNMAIHAHGWLMVHAGVLPQWSTAKTMALAAEVERALRGPDLKGFLRNMYGNTPYQWHDSLQGADRLRVVVNALTRLRFCTPEGVMEFATKEGAEAALHGYLPWFNVPGRQTADTPVMFGHWSALKARDAQKSGGLLLPLDTGCVWGGSLTAARLGAMPADYELISVACAQAQDPQAKPG